MANDMVSSEQINFDFCATDSVAVVVIFPPHSGHWIPLDS